MFEIDLSAASDASGIALSAGYRRMIETCAVGRAGAPDKVGNVADLLSGADGGFNTCNEFLMSGGVPTAYQFGEKASAPASQRGWCDGHLGSLIVGPGLSHLSPMPGSPGGA